MKTKTMVLIAMLTAILAILSILQIPMPSGVPITLQTFAVALCGYVLGSKSGAISTLLYVLLGAIGLPIFSGMAGGLGVLFGYAGGFLFGFIPMAFFCGLGVQGKNKFLSVTWGMLGLFLCHLVGILQFSFLSGNGFIPAFLMVSAPYLVKDILSVVGAFFVAMAIRNGLISANLIHDGHVSN